MRKLCWMIGMLLLPLLAQALPSEPFPTAGGSAIFAQKPEFLSARDAFVFSSKRLESGDTRLHWQIADGYYLYKQRIKIEGLGKAQLPALPAGDEHHDEYFGQQQIYRHSLEVLIPASAGNSVTVSWQGCADAGLCYPPQSQRIEPAGEPAQAASAAAAVQDQAGDQALARDLAQRSLGMSLLAFFGLGLLLAFTPCSLPMLPILAGVVVGSGAKPLRGLALASAYVVSMALIYAALGVIAALLGSNLQSTLQQPWVLGSFAGVFVLLALPMFGLFELQLPGFLRDRLEHAGRQRHGGSLPGAAALGALSGLMIGPCMTAPLAGALLYIAQTDNALHGALVLFSMGVGTGLPLLLLVTAGTRFLPRPGAWMNLVKGLFGFLLLGTALMVIRPLIGDVLWLALSGALLIVIAYSALLQCAALQRARLICTPPALIPGLWGVVMMVGAAAGSDDPWQPLKVYRGAPAMTVSKNDDAFTPINDPLALDRQLRAAASAGQWVLVDYYADWCVSCKVMEKNVFASSEALQALNGVRLLRLDVTADNDASRALLDRYRVPGPPTLVWIAPDGTERRERRITGEVDLATFLQHWQTTRERN